MELTVVMPCLNEAETLETCIRRAQQAITEGNIAGEVVVADNGSTDGSIEIAERLGARVVPVAAKGYGNALMGGIAAAAGKCGRDRGCCWSVASATASRSDRRRWRRGLFGPRPR